MRFLLAEGPSVPESVGVVTEVEELHISGISSARVRKQPRSDAANPSTCSLGVMTRGRDETTLTSILLHALVVVVASQSVLTVLFGRDIGEYTCCINLVIENTISRA